MGITFPITFDATFTAPERWIVDGSEILASTTEVATDRTLLLSFRVPTEQLLTALRPLKRNEGQVETLNTGSGGFVAVDRADGGNTFEFAPPLDRRPLRGVQDYHVLRYDETVVSQSVDEWTVELELVRASNRTDTPSLSQTPATSEWGFTLQNGSLATDRVDAQFIGRGEGGVRRFEITTRLTFDQAHVFESSLARLGGGRVRRIPDAENVAVDDTDDDAAIVTIDSPNTSVLADGDYLVTEWQSERLNDAYQTVSFTVAET